MFIDWFIPVLISAAIIGVLAVSVSIGSKKHKFTTKDIALAAVCVALSFVLSYFKVYKMPQGGSITIASILPVALFAYIAGFRKGLIVGLAYGLLQIIQDPQIFHPAQVFLDYFMGFGAIAVAGVFKHIKVLHKCDLLLGILAAGILRFAFSTLSGVVFFASYAGEMNVWIYSLGYNSVLLIDAAIALVAAVFMQYSRNFRWFINYMDDGNNFGRKKVPANVIDADAATSDLQAYAPVQTEIENNNN